MDSKTAYRKFKIQLNKLNTNFSEHLEEKIFCEMFNKAQYHFVNNLLKSEDGNKDNHLVLQQLLKDIELTGFQKDNLYLVDLPTDWYWVKRVSCKDDTCGNTLNCILVQESNVGRLLQNENWKPSVEWEETIFSVGDNKLRIYTDSFGVEKCNLIYYREPVKIDIATGENNIYGVSSKDVDPEWSDDIVENIIDLTVLIATSSIGDLQLFQSKSQLRPLNA